MIMMAKMMVMTVKIYGNGDEDGYIDYDCDGDEDVDRHDDDHYRHYDFEHYVYRCNNKCFYLR